MKKGLVYIVSLLLCMTVFMAGSSRASKRYWRGRELETSDLKGVELKDIQASKYYFNLPPFIYNMCALYYIMPDCLEELFGDDFDIASLVQEVCPLS